MGIIDMDGFRIQKQFLCKELGLLKVGKDTASSFFFDIGVRWSDLDEKDARSCRYIKKHIHKLPMGIPHGTKAYPIEALEELVIKFYEGIKKNGKSTKPLKRYSS